MSQPGPDALYRRAMADGRFTIQKCQDCKTHIHHPRVLCTNCGSDRLEAVEPTGKGTVYSVTVVRRRPEKGGPYNVCLIDLDEGPRVMSRVDDIAPGAVKIGMNVEAFIGDVDGAPDVLFRPADGAAS